MDVFGDHYFVYHISHIFSYNFIVDGISGNRCLQEATERRKEPSLQSLMDLDLMLRLGSWVTFWK